MQQSGLTEIILLIWTSAIWGLYPVFPNPELSQGSLWGVAAVWWLLGQVFFPSWVLSGLSSLPSNVGCNCKWLWYPLLTSVSVQLLSHVWLFVIPWTAPCQASLAITNSRNSPKPISIELMMPSNHFILCHPLLLPPSIFPGIRVFSNESALCIRWPKYWSFSFNISPTNEHPGLISFRMDWLDLLAVQGTLKRLLQHHSSKASILRCSAFFIIQLLHPYMATGKTIALTRWTFAGKVMSLLFNMLSRLVITFFPRSKHLLICLLTWQVIFHLSPTICQRLTETLGIEK